MLKCELCVNSDKPEICANCKGFNKFQTDSTHKQEDVPEPTPDPTEEQAIEELLSWIKRLEEDGCPPTGDCENYIVREETLAVDCEMCRKEELKKLLHSLGYGPVQEAERAAQKRCAEIIHPMLIKSGERAAMERVIDIDAVDWDGEVCKICGRNQRLAWYAPDELWAKVFSKDYQRVACLECFLREAEKKGVIVDIGEINFMDIALKSKLLREQGK